MYTAMSASNFWHNQNKVTGLAFELASCYIFHRALDIKIKKCYDDEYDTDSNTSEDDAIEIGRQADGTKHASPEKHGELIAHITGAKDFENGDWKKLKDLRKKFT